MSKNIFFPTFKDLARQQAHGKISVLQWAMQSFQRKGKANSLRGIPYVTFTFAFCPGWRGLRRISTQRRKVRVDTDARNPQADPITETTAHSLRRLFPFKVCDELQTARLAWRRCRNPPVGWYIYFGRRFGCGPQKNLVKAFRILRALRSNWTGRLLRHIRTTPDGQQTCFTHEMYVWYTLDPS